VKWLRNHLKRTGVRTAALGAAGLVATLAGGVTLSDRSEAVAAPGEESALLPAPGLRLISQSQYVNTIQRIFGDDIAVRIRFAPVKREDGLLAVGSSGAVITPGALDPLDATARAVAQQVVDEDHRDFLVPCKPADHSAADAACAGEFLAHAGRLLYRRPLTDGELAGGTHRAGEAARVRKDFYAGLAHSLAGMLVSPQFLYIRETAVPGGPAGGWQLDPYSKASRLAFLLWDSGPDDALLDAAARGELDSAPGIARQFERMVASPRYRDGVREFFSDFLVLETFDTLAKDPTIYPAFSLKAVAEAREQLLRTVADHLVDRKGDYRELFTTRQTQMSAELAVLYKVPVNTGSIGWVPYEFGQDAPRAGLLGQVGFLAQYAHAGRSSPTRRGRAVREVLLCQKVPDPPPNVDFSNFEDPKGGLHTARERLNAHNENPICAGCHKVTDPIGLTFETFDGAGQFRRTENSYPIDTSGSLDGVDFADAAGLGRALAQSSALRACVVNRLYAYAVGRKVLPQEEARLEGYQALLDKRGYRFDEMLRLIVLDPAFFAVRPVPALARADLLKGGAHATQN
jgi:hypothetical protein